MAASALHLFGQAVREQRLARGWTQEQLAERADLHENYISRLETGNQEPGLLVVLKLSRAFQLTPAELLDAFTAATLRAIRLR